MNLFRRGIIFIRKYTGSPRSGVIFCSARSLLNPATVKTASDENKSDTDFYLANVAPLNSQQRENSFRYLDMVLLTVLFLEIGGLIRLLLAK